MKREDATTNTTRRRGRKGDREVSEGGNGEVWVYNVGSDGAKGERKRGNKFDREKGEKDRDVYNGVYRGDNKEKREGGV